LKELLDGFNSMTSELQKNQNDIAELEREMLEGMAKQVAHEIKILNSNEASVQQLVAAYNDKKTEFDDILKNFLRRYLTKSRISVLSHLSSLHLQRCQA